MHQDVCIGVKAGIFLWISIVENPHIKWEQKILHHQQKKAKLQNMKLNLHIGDPQLCDKHDYLSFCASFLSFIYFLLLLFAGLNADMFTNTLKRKEDYTKSHWAGLVSDFSQVLLTGTDENTSEGLVKVLLVWTYPKKVCVRRNNRLSAACAATAWQQEQHNNICLFLFFFFCLAGISWPSVSH